MRTWTEGIWLFLPHPDQTGPLSGPAAPPGLRVAPSQAKRSPCTPTFRPSAGIDEVIALSKSRPPNRLEEGEPMDGRFHISHRDMVFTALRFQPETSETKEGANGDPQTKHARCEGGTPLGGSGGHPQGSLAVPRRCGAQELAVGRAAFSRPH